ncbi:MAG: ABC transporter permease [Planctomycetota bacterium]
MSVLAAPRLLTRHWRLLVKSTLVEVRKTYAGSVLGIAWVILGPALLLTLYTIIYAVIFKVRPIGLSVSEYIMYVFAGLVPFLAFATALPMGSASLSKDRQILLNTVFPAELLPARAVLVASTSLPVGLGIVLIGDAVLASATWHMVLIPIVVVLQVMFTCGLLWVLSLLTLLVRDVEHAIQYVVIALLIITPIAYTPDMIPDQLAVLMYGNPLYYFMASYQHLLIYDQLPPTPFLVGAPAISLVTFVAGYHIFHRAKLTFYDYA